MNYHIEGRRWFQRTFGNTYNTVTIYKDGDIVVKPPFAYGYGDYVLQRAQEWLGNNGHPELAEKHANGARVINLSIWLREHESGFSIIDVNRKRDL